MPFVQDAIEPRSRIHTDGWLGYEPLRRHGYKHRIAFLEGQTRSASQLLPHVHQVVSLLKRWLLGTHHGAVTHEHLDYYLDEFTFRFNRRRSASRGKLFSAWSSRRSPSTRRLTNRWSGTLECRDCRNHNLLWLLESSK